MNGITSEMLKAEGDCVYAFPEIKQAFNGDHREVLEDWKNGSVVKLESHLKRSLLGMFSSSVRPVRDAIGCQLALAFRPGSYRVPGGVKGHDPGRSQAGTTVAGKAKLTKRRRDLIVRTPRGTPPVAGIPPGHISYVTDQMNRIKPMPARLLNPAGASRGYIPDGHRRNWDLSLWWVPVRDPAARLRFGPILFPVANDWVLGKQQGKRRVKRHCDIAENTRDLQPLVTNIVRLQSALGSASGPKAINMLIGTRASLRSVTIDENKLKVVENFTFLESSTNKGQMDNELDCRLGKASAAFNQLGFEAYYVEISQEKRKETGITGCF
ncbi:hypothetical protein Bbelb_383530 [Branchiostoma belcheri]|nr:hypothetical protein Bbelb_383530 [Branchiostoma belcheri]